ncbi:MAG: hypothetical protein ACREOG_14210 [Gemmatimonadaceae bacterium]
MQNDDLDSSLQPLVDKLRELPESDPRAIKRVLARLRQADGLPNARRRALRRTFAQQAGWWAAAAVLVLGAGVTLLARSGAPPQASELAVAPVAPSIPEGGAFGDEATSADRLVARQFEIESRQARQVALVGDFNQWNPQRHRLLRDGRTARWYITVNLPAGLHKYAFIVNDSVWTPDPGALRTVDRDFGVTSSLVLVQ